MEGVYILYQWWKFLVRVGWPSRICVFCQSWLQPLFLEQPRIWGTQPTRGLKFRNAWQKKGKSQLHIWWQPLPSSKHLNSQVLPCSIDLMEVKNRTIDLETASTTCGGDSDVGLSDMSNKMVESNSSIFRRGGVLPTGLCLSKAAIGAGVLSMSVHSAEVGILYQLGCLLVAGALAVVSIRMISIASIETQRWSFEDICEELFHPVIWWYFICFLKGVLISSSWNNNGGKMNFVPCFCWWMPCHETHVSIKKKTSQIVAETNVFVPTPTHPAEVVSFFTGLINASVCLGSATSYLIVSGQVFVVIFQADDRARETWQVKHWESIAFWLVFLKLAT